MLKLVPALHEDPNELYTKANAYFAKGCLDVAESLYRKILELSSNGVRIKRDIRADVLHNLGMISERRHNLDGAISFYRQAVRSNKQHGMTWLFLARVYLERYEKLGEKQDYMAGLRALTRAAEIEPQFPVVKILKEKFAR